MNSNQFKVPRHPSGYARRGLDILIIFSVPVLFIVIDTVFDKGKRFSHWHPNDWITWASGILWELSVWVFLLLVSSSLLRRRWTRIPGWLAIYVLDLVGVVLVAISLGYHAYFQQYPDFSTFVFARDEPRNVWSMLRDSTGFWTLAWFVATLATVVGLHRFSVRRWMEGPIFLETMPLARLAIVMLAVTAIPLAFDDASALTIMAKWCHLGMQVSLGDEPDVLDHGLHASVRMPLPPPERPGPRVNILIILNESLRADTYELLHDSLYHSFDARVLAPRAQQWQMDSLTTMFSHAYSNATATEVSCSSWMTGLPPWESSVHFHAAPTIWDAAHAAGRRTFLLSSQDWNWQGLQRFFFDKSLRRIVDRNAFKAPVVNDLGIDDALLPDSLRALATESDTPFLAVLQFNSTHWPYFDPNGLHRGKMLSLPWDGPSRSQLPPGSRQRYMTSVRYVDSVQDACLHVLDEAGILDRTLVIVVSDHGESIGERDLARLACFYEETVRIPFYVRLPRRGLDIASARRNLSAWRDRNVTLLDLAPTIFDLLGYSPGIPQRFFQQGASLLAPPPDTERIIDGQTTGAVRSWGQQGGYSLRGCEKFVFHTGKSPGLYDLATDPRELRNLWSNPVVRARALVWLRKDFAIPGRASLCRRAKDGCPEELCELRREPGSSQQTEATSIHGTPPRR